jgi:glucose-1-phosphate thymidylyltransferase
MAKSKEMKGLILCAGLGTRMRPITYTLVKPLIPVANKPCIHYGIEALRDAGIRDVGIVVGVTGPTVMKALGTGKKWGMNFTYITQENPGGLAHAALCAEEYMDGSPFLMYLGDNLIQGGVPELADRFRKGNTAATIMLKPVAEPQHFGVAEVGRNNAIKSLVEKPKKPKSNLAIVGIYCFSAQIFEAARSIKPSWRGELEITDAIAWLLNNGRNVDCHITDGWWHDTGQKNDMLEANRSILGLIKRSSIQGKVDKASRLTGKIVIERGAKITNSRIHGPGIIARGAVIEDAYIGPFTAIDEKARVSRSEVADSILMRESCVEDLPGRLQSSLLGPLARIGGGAARPRIISCMISDRSQVEIF